MNIRGRAPSKPGHIHLFQSIPLDTCVVDETGVVPHISSFLSDGIQAWRDLACFFFFVFLPLTFHLINEAIQFVREDNSHILWVRIKLTSATLFPLLDLLLQLPFYLIFDFSHHRSRPFYSRLGPPTCKEWSTRMCSEISRSLTSGGVNHYHHPQHYIYYRGGLLHRNIQAICQAVDK